MFCVFPTSVAELLNHQFVGGVYFVALGDVVLVFADRTNKGEYLAVAGFSHSKGILRET
jgi:hypothetical protein